MAFFFFLSNFIFFLHIQLERIKLTCDHQSAWCFQQQFGPQMANIDQSTLKHKWTVFLAQISLCMSLEQYCLVNQLFCGLIFKTMYMLGQYWQN